MQPKAISQQMLLEHELLAHLADALRTAIGWNLQGDATRKVSTLRFLTASFQRHLSRLIELEERDGYMNLMAQADSGSAAQIEDLRRQHEELRADLEDLLPRIERLYPSDVDSLASISDDLLEFLDRIDEHSDEELQLLSGLLLPQETS